jgi:hypothetical protein
MKASKRGKKPRGIGGREMKDKRKKTFIASMCLLVILTSNSITFLMTPRTTATVFDHNEETEKIVVQIVDASRTKEIVVTLPQHKAADVEKVIDTTSKKLHQARSSEELREITGDALRSLRSLGLFKTDAELDTILQGLKRTTQRHSPLQGRETSPGIFHWNAFCFIIGDTTNTQFVGIRTITLNCLISILQHRRFSGRSIAPFMFISLFFDTIKPFAVWQRIILGVFHIPGGTNPAEGWIMTDGLTGLRIWNGPLIGNIPGSSELMSTGAIGFTGIKILHDHLSKNFYLGTVLLVSIYQ